jgi:hypothetical protein
MMKLHEIKRSARALTTKELEVLDVWLHNLIGVRESKMRESHAGKQQGLQGARRTARKTYRLQVVRCGKENCKCRKGSLHGPYWYACWVENGKTKSQYIGKKLPKGVQHPRAKRDALPKTQT